MFHPTTARDAVLCPLSPEVAVKGRQCRLARLHDASHGVGTISGSASASFTVLSRPPYHVARCAAGDPMPLAVQTVLWASMNVITEFRPQQLFGGQLITSDSPSLGVWGPLH